MEPISAADSSLAHVQNRTRLLGELAALIAQRDAIDRTAPGAAMAVARLASQIGAKGKELRESNAAIAAAGVVLEALCKRATLDKTLMDMGYEPDPDYIARTYGPGWHRKPEPTSAPALPPALDPVMALTAVTDRMADLVESQGALIATALSAPTIVQNTVLPATVDVAVTATMPARQTITDIQRDPRSGDMTRTVQTERDLPAS